MVDCQLRTYDVTDRAVLAAMGEVPRELFVPPERREIAYIDQPVALAGSGAGGRWLLAPMTCGRMLQALDVQPGQSFFDYASGTGYTAAVASRLGAVVTAFEPEQDLQAGMAEALAQAAISDVQICDAMPLSQFDLVFVNGACEQRPESLFERLGAGGRLIVVEGQGRAGRAMLYQRAGDSISGRAVFDTSAPVLARFRQPEAFVFG